MKYNNKCIVCFDGKIVRGVYGRVISSTQYKFTAQFCYYGEVEIQTFRKQRNSRKKTKITAVSGHKRFTKGYNSGIFVVIPMNQFKSWYHDYVETIGANTLGHMNKEVWE